jgi:hypothetical protein
MDWAELNMARAKQASENRQNAQRDRMAGDQNMMQAWGLVNDSAKALGGRMLQQNLNTQNVASAEKITRMEAQNRLDQEALSERKYFDQAKALYGKEGDGTGRTWDQLSNEEQEKVVVRIKHGVNEYTAGSGWGGKDKNSGDSAYDYLVAKKGDWAKLTDMGQKYYQLGEDGQYHLKNENNLGAAKREAQRTLKDWIAQDASVAGKWTDQEIKTAIDNIYGQPSADTGNASAATYKTGENMANKDLMTGVSDLIQTTYQTMGEKGLSGALETDQNGDFMFRKPVDQLVSFDQAYTDILTKALGLRGKESVDAMKKLSQLTEDRNAIANNLEIIKNISPSDLQKSGKTKTALLKDMLLQISNLVAKANGFNASYGSVDTNAGVTTQKQKKGSAESIWKPKG